MNWRFNKDVLSILIYISLYIICIKIAPNNNPGSGVFIIGQIVMESEHMGSVQNMGKGKNIYLYSCMCTNIYFYTLLH